jgi:hypothetical protein
MSHIGVARIVAVAVAVFTSCCMWTFGEARGERVGYSFKGNFIQPVYRGGGTPPIDYNVFGFHFPFTAPFSGTFSYDTSTPSLFPDPSETNIKDFKQVIQGGFTFNVLNSDGVTPIFRLAADAYDIQVSNDQTPEGAPVASDLVTVEFNTFQDPTLPPIIRDGSAYITKKPVSISAPLCWDWSMFNDPDDPKLRAELPEDGTFPFQGAMVANGVASFVINSFSRLAPAAADYNIDGNVAKNDYLAWRSAFGQTSPDYRYADGNHDGVVDAADYIIWRHASGLGALGAGSSFLPEPSTALLTAISLLILAGFKRRRIPCA